MRLTLLITLLLSVLLMMELSFLVPARAGGEAGPSPKKKGLVCCEIFGYGSRMKKCCFKHEWTQPENCKVPAKLTGGGRTIVSDSLCEKAQAR